MNINACQELHLDAATIVPPSRFEPVWAGATLMLHFNRRQKVREKRGRGRNTPSVDVLRKFREGGTVGELVELVLDAKAVQGGDDAALQACLHLFTRLLAHGQGQVALQHHLDVLVLQLHAHACGQSWSGASVFQASVETP